jgi:hypothetical protein
VAWLLRRRRREKEHGLILEHAPSLQPDPTSAEMSLAPVTDHNSNLPGFTGYKAELAADSSPSDGSLVSPLSHSSPQFQGQQRQYEAYNPNRHSNYSQYATRNSCDTSNLQRDTMYGSAYSISPQHTGSSLDHTIGANERTRQQTMAPIAELQG